MLLIAGEKAAARTGYTELQRWWRFWLCHDGSQTPGNLFEPLLSFWPLKHAASMSLTV